MFIFVLRFKIFTLCFCTGPVLDLYRLCYSIVHSTGL